MSERGIELLRKHLPEAMMLDALNRLARLVPDGEQLVEKDGPGFIHAAAGEIERLRAKLAEAEQSRDALSQRHFQDMLEATVVGIQAGKIRFGGK